MGSIFLNSRSIEISVCSSNGMIRLSCCTWAASTSSCSSAPSLSASNPSGSISTMVWLPSTSSVRSCSPSPRVTSNNGLSISICEKSFATALGELFTIPSSIGSTSPLLAKANTVMKIMGKNKLKKIDCLSRRKILRKTLARCSCSFVGILIS